ncbi:MAG: caspase family protein, partial [Planctomycetaceae bacterium]|nr:caspase family protein [Planctomycetaceae bacterium]
MKKYPQKTGIRNVVQGTSVSLYRHVLIVMLTTLLLLTATVFVNAGQSGSKYAIIIAVSQYDSNRIPSLPLVANDATALANTLHQRGGYEIIPLFESFDRDVPTSSRTVPTKDNIVSEVTSVLKKCKPDDTVFLYFSGHGVQHPQTPGKTYLLPRNADVTKIDDTFLETAWLRDLLARCQATTKFFIIDACHAGGDKSVNLDLNSDQHKSLSSHELVDSGITGVVTLASSTKN